MSTNPNHSHRPTRRCDALFFTVAMMALLCSSASVLHAASPNVVITPAAGYTITWNGLNGAFSGAAPPDNIALATHGTVPFTSSDYGPFLGIPFHRVVNLNDGLYDNSHSWISHEGADPDPFAGLRFAASVGISSIAWSRDNTPTAYSDRTIGTYTLQFTTVAGPDGSTPFTGDAATGWENIGTVQYLGSDANFTSYRRHRFDVAQGGSPIAATGLRIKVSDSGIDLAEIEVNPPADPPLTLTPAAGFTITWNGTDGAFFGDAPPDNIALATHGTVPFTSSDLGPFLGIPYHRVENLNDGLYNNSHSWISVGGCCGGSDPDPYAGLRFAASVDISSIAWSRDNTPDSYSDRSIGIYTLQFTTVAGPDGSTPFTGDAATGWKNIGTVQYLFSDANFTSYRRHRFDVAQGGSPIAATGLRIKVSDSGIDLAEIEVNPAPDPTPVTLTPAAGYSITWNGNNGLFNNPAAGAAPPDNRALASHGTTPFTSSDYGPFLGIPYHRVVNLNDGLYGNLHSWISHEGADPDPFAGLNFNGTVTITNIAWSRDNGDAVGEDTYTDRVLGLYTIQITMTAVPDAATPDTGDAATGWETVGTIEYRFSQPPAFTPALRHAFGVTAGGAGITATGLRIKVPNSGIDLDEIEVYVVQPSIHLTIGRTNSTDVLLTWDSVIGNQYQVESIATVDAPAISWTAVGGPLTATGASLSLSDTIAPNLHRYYRVRKLVP